MSTTRTMAGALLYLRAMSIVGQVKSRLARLKQPKYLAGAVVGAAWIWLTFLRQVNRPVRNGAGPIGRGGPPDLPVDALPVIAELGALALIVVLLVNWAVPRRATLAFSEAEIAFLFPAPVTRRMLIHYRLLAAQLGIIFTSLVFTVIFRRGLSDASTLWFHAIGWWITLVTLNLHFTGTSFVYSKLLNRSLTHPRLKVAVLAFVYGVLAALVLWALFSLRLPLRADLANAATFFKYVSAQLHLGPLPWLLAVPKLLIGPYFASGMHDFLIALWPALIVLVVHYFWVVRTEVSFEEASIARAEKRGAQARAAQSGDWRGQPSVRKAQAEPFKLTSVGRPELAFLWKNLIASGNVFRLRTLLIAWTIVIAGSQWVLHSEKAFAHALGSLCFMVIFFITLLFGPLIAQQDLRSDLRNADILKTYPLHGWQVLLGELLTPLAVLTAVLWTCLLGLFFLMPTDRIPGLDPSMRGGLALGLALIAPPFVAIQLLVPNAAAVIFPAWALSATRHAERGVEVMGQRLIFMTGQLLITAFAIVPALIASGIVFAVGQWLSGFWAGGTLAVIVMCAVLAAEAWVGVLWLGGRFEHFDLSAELRP